MLYWEQQTSGIAQYSFSLKIPDNCGNKPGGNKPDARIHIMDIMSCKCKMYNLRSHSDEIDHLTHVSDLEISGYIHPVPFDRSEAENAVHCWLSVCSREHRCGCQSRRANLRQKPSRLLDLDPNHQDTVRLVSTDDITSCWYITLSHRWGNAEPPKLTAEEEGG